MRQVTEKCLEWIFCLGSPMMTTPLGYLIRTVRTDMRRCALGDYSVQYNTYYMSDKACKVIHVI